MGRSAPLAEALSKSAQVVAAVASGASFDAAFPAVTCDLDSALSAAVRDISTRALRAYTVDRALVSTLMRQPADDAQLLCLLWQHPLFQFLREDLRSLVDSCGRKYLSQTDFSLLNCRTGK